MGFLEKMRISKKISNIRKELSPREQVLFDTLYEDGGWLTSQDCKIRCGYAMSGWTLSRLNELGVVTKYCSKDKTYRIERILY